MDRLPGDLVIRVAEPEDRLRTNAVRWAVGWKGAPAQHSHWPEADADWQTRHYFREIVAEVDGVIAARVGLEAYQPPFAQLVDLCVRPEYRRRGLGEQLTRACQEAATRRGFRALFLQTELDNSSAHRLYASLGFVPTAYGKMLRMVKFLDYPLIDDFRRAHPLNQYWCTPAKDRERTWDMEWHAYITEDYLRLRLEGGSTQSDSAGIGPALTGLVWRVGQGARQLEVKMQPEATHDLEPGDHVALDLLVENRGQRMERGVFQMLLPPGVMVSSPATNQERVFLWETAPGEQITQPVVLQIEPSFDADALWHLNYGSLPICMETYWEGHRALLSVSLHLAVPPP
jgi:ribosomal protein S18 acetylase RimI-like enzyme